ncbi:MAG: hypothetical protein IKC26_10775 [Clostridia bacterium]|nr:hypothetical protein [Clostridia bacterium]MBR2908508.1 hypothetical protein [Clostridia bacterium]
MTAVLCILAFSVIGLITVVLLKPSVRLPVVGATVSIYWVPPLVGVCAVLISGLLSPSEVLMGLTASGDVNPLKILTLFLSMTFLSVFLDEAKFFGYLATAILKKAGRNQFRFFLYLFLTVSVLTIFTSNDIIVLTFTPFLCYFAKRAKIDPLPYFICEFAAANTFSMALMIGNPTNIYLSASAGVDFGTYLSEMWLPTLLAGVTVLAMLLLLFYKRLSHPMTNEISATEEETTLDKGFLAIGLVHLGLCIVLLTLSSYLPIPMWLLTLIFAISLLFSVFVYQLIKRKRSNILLRSFGRLPYDIVPFVLSMFVLVLALDKYGVTGVIRDLLSGEGTVFRYGFASFLSANVLNNIPMSVLFSPVVRGIADAGARTTALYATVIGSNLGAFFTPIGALAGIMWSAMLKKYSVRLSFLDFIRYGAAIAIPSLVMALLGVLI